MAPFSKLKDRLSGKHKKSGSVPKDAEPTTRPEPAVASKKHVNRSVNTANDTPPKITDPLKPAEQQIDPWIRAFEIFQEEQPELAIDYKKHLASLQGSRGSTVADLSTPRSVESIVKQQLQVRASKQWQVALLGKEINIREQIEKLVSFLLWTDPIVKNAVSAQPYAALAWSGVSLLLPLLTSGTTQNAAMLRCFASASDVQLYWEICEQTYLHGVHKQQYQSLVKPLAKLYSQVIECQARAICHLSKAQLSRAWTDVVGSNDWDGIASQIEASSRNCSNLIPPLQEGEIRGRWKIQLQEMQESRAILDEIRRILDQSARQTLKLHEEKQAEDLLQNLASDYKGDKNFNPQRVEGTCEWFFTDDRFLSWRNSNSSALLWVTAGPGCGKSVLSRALIDERRVCTRTSVSTVCYFFFKDGEARRMYSTNALCAILHQLFVQDTSSRLIRKALPVHKNYGKLLCDNFSELWDILVSCATSSDVGEVVCVLDALDECKAKSRQQLIDQLKAFYSTSSSSKLKFLITSRPYTELEISFGKICGASSYLRFDGDDKSEQISKEINLVIDHRLKDITQGFADKDRSMLSDRLKLLENRTYLWLYLTFDAIEQSGSMRRADVELLLNTLAGTVSEMYERMLNRSKDQAHTECLLRIILGAEEPLTIDQANVALTLSLQNQNFTSQAELQSELWPKDNFSNVIKNLCGLFISIRDSKLSFIHQTAREFLLNGERQGQWQGHFTMPDAHSAMLKPCTYYLALPVAEPPENVNTTNSISFSKSWNGFLSYAARYWTLHFISRRSHEANADDEEQILALALELCNPETKQYRTWSAVNYKNGYIHPKENANRLIVASYFGLKVLVIQLLDIVEVDVNSGDQDGLTPLICAVAMGYPGIVKRLLDTRKVDVNLKSRHGWTALNYAVGQGSDDLVKQLLNTGMVDVNLRDGYGNTPLNVAVQQRHTTICKQLLDTAQVDVNLPDETGTTPLLCAARGGSVAMTQMLIETRKVDVNLSDHFGFTPLICAALEGHDTVVEQLLDTRMVDVNQSDRHGNTALNWAAQRMQMTTIKQLLDTGQVDVDVPDINGETPMIWAVKKGSVAMVELLLDTGKVDLNAKDHYGNTPLVCAARKGQEAVVRQLLATDKADVNLTENFGDTPLICAAQEGHVAVVKLLLDNGKADVNFRNMGGQTALSMAKRGGHRAIVELLQPLTRT